ncbi:hypothetical protein C0992_005785 [Termitomyces sp. T32_za158]|nr:hypothetical protein C0992_005785 [Termitomyces sp. T32_za158]
MSSSDAQRADQIAFHFYTKLFYVVSHARTTNPSPGKLNRWFNLDTPDSDLFTKEDREPYKSVLTVAPPPLEVQVLLTVPELANNQVLVHVPPESSRVRIHPTPRFVLLETFVLDFIPGEADVQLPTTYKHGISLFRSLFTLLRVLPAWKLHKRLRRRTASLGITLRVGSRNDPDILSLTNAESKTYTFPPLRHPMGSFALSTTYLSHPTFQLDELESLLSSRFLSQDQRPFTPTLAKAPTASSSPSPPRQPSSLPRSSLGKQSITAATLSTGTPPRAQILKQADSSTSSLSPSNSFYNPAAGQDVQPRPRYPFPFKSNTVSSTAFPSSSLGSGSGSGHPSSLSVRISQHERERERVASLPPTPDIPVSQSPSYSHVPLPSQRTGPIPLHVRQASLPRPSPTPSFRDHDSPEDPTISTSTSASTSGCGMRKRYSSSFGHRYAPTPPLPSPSASSPSQARPSPMHPHSPQTTHSPPLPSPSSSGFPRNVPPQTQVQAQSPSSPLYPIPRGRSSIGNQVRTDDEDISLFMQDIEMRKPLLGRSRTPGSGSGSAPSGAGSVVDQQQQQRTGVFDIGVGLISSSPTSGGSEAETSQRVSPRIPALPALPQSPPGGLVLTTEAEVDARLSKMNQEFLRSLQGLGSPSGSGSGRRRERNDSQSQNQSQRGDWSVSGRGRREREREREREWTREVERDNGTAPRQDSDAGRERGLGGTSDRSDGHDAWVVRPHGLLARQEETEVVGRMDMYSGGVDLDELDPPLDASGRGSGGR